MRDIFNLLDKDMSVSMRAHYQDEIKLSWIASFWRIFAFLTEEFEVDWLSLPNRDEIALLFEAAWIPIALHLNVILVREASFRELVVDGVHLIYECLLGCLV